MAEKQAIGLDNNRLNHCCGVARECKRIAEQVFRWNQYKCEDMFMLGFLHDIGYEFAAEQSQHPEKAAEILGRTHYQYDQEILWHGKPNLKRQYITNELMLLNLADLTTSPTGAHVNIETRLVDIKERYGEDSQQLKDATELSQQVRNFFAEKGLDITKLEVGTR